MLALEVENINGEANLRKDRITLDMFCKRAIVVIEDVVGHTAMNAKHPLDHFLPAKT
jgi:hypothetical protein